MGRKFPKKVIDITGIELTPGEPNVCLGNGDQGLECCCDECDYFLLCFPEYKPQWIKDLYDETTDKIIEEKKSMTIIRYPTKKFLTKYLADKKIANEPAAYFTQSNDCKNHAFAYRVILD